MCLGVASRAVTLSAALTLAACSMGPDYVRPSAPVAAAYKEALPSPDTSNWKPAQPGTLAAQRWWEVYGDPQLNALEVQVATANQNVVAAAARYRSAQATIAQFRSALFPTLSIDSGFTQTHASQNVLFK